MAVEYLGNPEDYYDELKLANEERQRKVYLPTPEEIETATEAIRARWPEAVRKQRLIQKCPEVNIAAKLTFGRRGEVRSSE